MFNSEQKYYELLGVTESATLADIKRAYRKKALLLHPDKNKAPGAHEDFIALTEAYEYLTNSKSGKTATQYQDWIETEREQARERAAEYARMRHEEFINSDYYKTSQAVGVVLSNFFFFFAIIFVVAVPLIGYLVAQGSGLIVAVVLLVISSPPLIDILIVNRPEIDFKVTGNAAKLVFTRRPFLYSAALFLNIILLLTITLNTQLATYTILLIFTLAALTGWIASRYLFGQHPYFSKPLTSICVAVTLVNLFFVTNYVLATDPQKETYAFQHQLEYYSSNTGPGSYQKKAYIHLAGNKYEEDIWLRMFRDFDAMRNSDTITYTFEQGPFGFRVMKSFKFN